MHKGVWSNEVVFLCSVRSGRVRSVCATKQLSSDFLRLIHKNSRFDQLSQKGACIETPGPERFQKRYFFQALNRNCGSQVPECEESTSKGERLCLQRKRDHTAEPSKHDLVKFTSCQQVRSMVRSLCSLDLNRQQRELTSEHWSGFILANDHVRSLHHARRAG